MTPWCWHVAFALCRMVPVVLLMSLVMFFYAFLGFILYRDET